MKYLFLILCLLLTGCPAEVMPDEGGISEAGASDVKYDVTIKDAGIDTKNPEAGLNFDMEPPSPATIKYFNGSIMTVPAKVYLLWYGSWNNSSTIPLIEDLVMGLSESPYFNITSTYFANGTIDSQLKINQIGNIFATSKLIFGKSVLIEPTLGKNLTDVDIFMIVSNAVDNQQVPADPNAIYLVLTSSDVRQGSFGGFCGSYCGWHDHHVYNQTIELKFGFIGDPAQCLDVCTAKTKYDEYGIDHSPNSNWSADGMASVIAHELTETITDPVWDLSRGWQDDFGYENADKCAWNYGPVYLTSGGSVANVKLGNREYLLQQNWLLDGDAGQHCALHP